MIRHTIHCRRPGRPYGEIAQAIMAALVHRPKTANQLARELRCNLAVVRDKCRRLREAGQIEIAERLRLEGVNKPVARYTLTPRSYPIENTRQQPLFEAGHA